MKETICTIPINEIFDEEHFCPFCNLEQRLNDEEIKYALGPAMMEPDYRVLTNGKWFCKTHARELNTLPKALPLALILQSRLEETKDLFDPPEREKKGFFSSDKNTALDTFIKKNADAVSRCVICERIEKYTERYFDIFAGMVKNSSEFYDKVKNCGGFCMPHFAKALFHLRRELKGDKLYDAVEMLCAVQKKKYEKYRDDINAFTESFDYKNAGKPCPVSADTVIKSCFFENGEFEPTKKKLEDV